MKTVLYIVSSLLILQPFLLISQISNTPPRSFSLPKNGSNISQIIMPKFDLKQLQKEDSIHDRDSEKLFRFGHEFHVDINVKENGTLTKLANGDKIWNLVIKSAGARTLNFIFDQYRLPKGATLHLYNQDKSFVLGAYTDKMNNENNSLGTWLADGDAITLAYFEPASINIRSLLHINKVIHGYRSVTSIADEQNSLNNSKDCNQDVNCDIGADFDEKKAILKQSVAFIIFGNNVCTGTLINNTANDKAPYILTAFHCQNNTDENNWAFRFNWISTKTVCATREESVDNGPDNYYQTTSGADRVALNENSDMRLLKLKGGLDDRWNLTWAGWDRTGNAPSIAVGIHHPNGDIMKVCRDNEAPNKTRVEIGKQTVDTWKVNNWDIGITEIGSSGSALFDQNGHIIGHLFGGEAECIKLTDNDLSDFYGRFDISWDIGSTPQSRLSDWLDPNHTGIEILNELVQQPSLNVMEVVPGDKQINLYPNPVQDKLFINKKTFKNISYQLYELSGRLIATGLLTGRTSEIKMTHYSSGMYFLTLTDVSAKVLLQEKVFIQ